MVRRVLLVAGVVLLIVLAISAVAVAAIRYADRLGDTRGGAGPDIVSVTMSHTTTRMAFRVQFAHAPPLRTSTRKSWVDMLLIGIDVPPLGPPPIRPGGEWPGADFALGTHGPSTTGQVVRLGRGAPATTRLVAAFKVTTCGKSLTFSIPLATSTR